MKVGPLFADSIHTEKIPKRHPSYEDSRGIRYWLFFIFLLLFIGILGGRLFWMQIIQGSYYRNLSNSNRIRTTPIHAPRGVIFDRHNTPLVINAPGYREVIDGKTHIISNEEAITLLSKGDTHLEIDSLRKYPCSTSCAHVLGYIGQISEKEIKLPQFAEYQPTDLVGKMGIEKYYEGVLKGIDGAKLTEVNSMGQQVRVLGQTDPIPGQNITITLDKQLQERVGKAMAGAKRGAAIVENTKGEILALYSSPSFDPNLFTMGKGYSTCQISNFKFQISNDDNSQTQQVDSCDSTYQSIEQILLDNTNHPLLDRAIAGTYPPGSTFKLVTAAAALQNKIIDKNFTIEDKGILRVGDFSFANWYYTQYGRTEGQVDVVKAIQRSNDIFFYLVGQKVGVDRLSGFAKQFDVGSLTGIDLPEEQEGLLPTKEWKEKVIGDKWYLGDDYHYGIGQGYLLTTPLQVNLWTQAIANEGALFTPHLLMRNTSPVKTHLLTQENVALIRQGMIESCNTGGVAWPLFNFNVKGEGEGVKIDGKDFYKPENATSSGQIGVRIACKTGTAQHGGEETLPHAWITLFAPAYHPEIIVTVLVEESGEGSNIAAPIAKQILEAYFGK